MKPLAFLSRTLTPLLAFVFVSLPFSAASGQNKMSVPKAKQAKPASQPAAKPASRPATKAAVQAPAIRFLGMGVLPQPAKTLRRLLSWKDVLPIPPRMLQRAKQMGMLLPMFLPGFQLKPKDDIFTKVPEILTAAGLDVNVPIGAMFNQYKKKVWVTGALKIELDKIQPLIARVRMKMTVKKLNSGVQALYVGPNVDPAVRKMMKKRGRTLPPPRLLGVLLKNQYLLTVSRQIPRGMPSPAQQLDFLQKLATAQANPLQAAINKAMNPRVQRQMKRGELDLVLAGVTPEKSPVEPFVPRMLYRLFKTGNIALSFANGIAVQMQTQWSKDANVFLSIFQPSIASLSMRKNSPANTAWFGGFHINTQAVLNFYNWVKLNKLLSPSRILDIEKGWKKSREEIKKRGIDILKLYHSLTGQFASGYLWTSDMPERIAYLTRRIRMKNGLKGAYAMVGFHQPKETHTFLRTIANHAKKLFPKDSNIKVEIRPYGKDTVLNITLMPRGDTMRLVAHGSSIWFFGDATTHEAFAKVWNKKAPALSSVIPNTSEIYQKYLKNQRHTFVVLPYAWRQLVTWLGPKRTSKWVKPFLDRTRVMASYNSFQSGIQESFMGLELSRKSVVSPEEAKTIAKSLERFQKAKFSKAPKGKQGGRPIEMLVGIGLSMTSSMLSSTPLVGVLAAVAIPAFMKYIRRSKASEATMYLYQLRTSALAYYSQARKDKAGKALPPTFPCANMGWICSPKAKPCHKGQTKFKANPKHWQHACWKQLRFSIPSSHYYRYCYRSAGQGESASFTIRAQGDLDCDTRLSTFEIQGYIGNGKPIVTPIRRQNPLE